MSVQCPQVHKRPGSALALDPERTRAHLSHCHSGPSVPERTRRTATRA